MGFRSKGSDPEEAAAKEAVAADAATEVNESPDMQELLSLESIARNLAENYPDSPNCDAMKAALRNASHGIGHVRKVLAQNARLA